MSEDATRYNGSLEELKDNLTRAGMSTLGLVRDTFERRTPIDSNYYLHFQNRVGLRECVYIEHPELLKKLTRLNPYLQQLFFEAIARFMSKKNVTELDLEVPWNGRKTRTIRCTITTDAFYGLTSLSLSRL